MEIILCAREDDLFNAWQLVESQFNFVKATRQDIMSIPAEAVVSPANSFGDMTGGIDVLYRNYFGNSVEKQLQYTIKEKFNGELCIGQAVVVPLNRTKDSIYTYDYMISAPTMRVPENISHTINAFLAAKAVLIEAKKHDIKSVVFPGMGTGTGCMNVMDCAKQMIAAINYVLVMKKPEGLYPEQEWMRKHVVSEKWYKVQNME